MTTHFETKKHTQHLGPMKPIKEKMMMLNFSVLKKYILKETANYSRYQIAIIEDLFIDFLNDKSN